MKWILVFTLLMGNAFAQEQQSEDDQPQAQKRELTPEQKREIANRQRSSNKFWCERAGGDFDWEKNECSLKDY